MKLGWVLLGCVLFVGCGDDDGATDAGLDAGATDAGGGVDASRADAGTTDAGPACDYVGVDEVVVRCDGDFTFVSYFSSTVESCDPFWGFSPEGPRFEDAASAIGSDPSCDADCQYDFSMSISRVYCGRRSGYEVLTAEGCPDVYRFDTGWYASVEEHDAANPCPAE